MNALSKNKHIWIDTDIIFNKPDEEVDDGLALMMALNNDDVRIDGISLIQGVENGYAVTQKLLGFYAQYQIPLHKGTDDATDGTGTKTPAVEALAEALQEHELSVIALGPATNIANLLEFYPESARNIKELVFCAGRQRGASFTTDGSVTTFPDYNFEMDPESMLAVIQSPIPVTLSGFGASSTLFLYQQDIDAIRENGREGDRWVYQQLQPWLDRWEQQLQIDGFIPFDTCTTGHILYPDYFHYHRNIPVAVEERANDAPVFSDAEQKPYLDVSYELNSPDKVDFVHTTDPDYKQIVMDNLLGR